MRTDHILGAGLSFPFDMTAEGEVALARGEQDVEQAIGIILSTAPGERPMRPEFGCRIHEFVFDILDAAAVGRIQRAVREALARWEPRVRVIDVTCNLAYAERGIVEVGIQVEVRDTNHVRNLVYPFYSIPGEPGP